MFICKSYIKKPNIKINNLDEINKKFEKYFIEVSQKNIITQVANKLDLNYLEGAIYLKYQDKTILDFKLWDYVDQLWAYVINLVEEFILNGNSQTLFPDQPTKIKFENISDEYMTMIVENDRIHIWNLPKKEFLNTLLNESELFFTNITESLNVPESHYTFELSKIEELKEKI